MTSPAMNSLPLEPIYLLCADLVPAANHGYNKFAGPQGWMKPSTFSFPIAQMCHWALLVRDRCYEVTAMDYEKDPVFKDDYDRTYRRPLFTSQWLPARNLLHVNHERIKVGATVLSDDEISAKATRIFEVRCENGYNVQHTNCQDFAQVLFTQICVGKNLVSKQETKSWHRIPFRLSAWRGLLKAGGVLAATGGVHVVLATAADKNILSKKTCRLLDDLVEQLSDAALAYAILDRNEKYQRNVRAATRLWVKFEKYKQYLDPELSNKLRAPRDDYRGYDIGLVNIYSDAGFEVSEITAALDHLGVKNNDGRPLHLSKEASRVLMSFLLLLQDDNHNSSTRKDYNKADDAYQGYNKNSVNVFTAMGFRTNTVVSALQKWGCDTGNGAEFEFGNVDSSTLIDTMFEIQDQSH